MYSLNFNPFRPNVPVDALYCTPEVDAFLRRVELGIADAGYVMITGDPGTRKTVDLRLLAQRLERMRARGLRPRPGWIKPRDSSLTHVAFHPGSRRLHPGLLLFTDECPARICPCQRFAHVLTDMHA